MAKKKATKKTTTKKRKALEGAIVRSRPASQQRWREECSGGDVCYDDCPDSEEHVIIGIGNETREKKEQRIYSFSIPLEELKSIVDAYYGEEDEEDEEEEDWDDSDEEDDPDEEDEDWEEEEEEEEEEDEDPEPPRRRKKATKKKATKKKATKKKSTRRRR